MYVIEIQDESTISSIDGYFSGTYRGVDILSKNINGIDDGFLYTIKTYRTEKEASNAIKKLEDFKNRNASLYNLSFKIKKLDIDEEILIKKSKEYRKEEIEERRERRKKEKDYYINLSIIEPTLQNNISYYLENNNQSKEERAFAMGRISILEEIKKSLQIGKNCIENNLDYEEYLQNISNDSEEEDEEI